MTQRLQIILAAALILILLMLVNRVRKEKLDLKYALPWITLLVGLLVIDAFPGITEWLASVMGIALPINMLMLLGLAFSVTVIFFLTSMMSKEIDKQKQLTQEVGLLRKRVDELESFIAKAEMTEKGED